VIPGDAVFRTRADVRYRIVAPEAPAIRNFLRVNSGDGRVGYAPLILRPRTLGEHKVAVVLSTNTWQAYNYEDENGESHFRDVGYADYVLHVDASPMMIIEAKKRDQTFVVPDVE
jgi:hypothetical protein